MYKNIYVSISESWINLVREIMMHGEINTTEYGTRSKFINGISLEIQDLSEKWDKRDPILGAGYLVEYKKQFRRDYRHNFSYTYIDRFVKPYDQFNFIRQELLKGRAYSKRLNAITWQNEFDMSCTNTNQPCLQSAWFYPYPDKTLDIHIRFRSNDIFKAYQADIIGLMYMFNEEILKPTNHKIKTLRYYGDNCHIYEEDWDEADKI